MTYRTQPTAFLLFIDYEKAYDYLSRNKLWEMINNKIPNHLLNTIKCIYRDTKFIIKFNDGISVRGFKPSRSRRIFKGEKILSTPSFGGEVKPSVPCRRFAACKRSLNGVEDVILGKITGQHSRPQFPLPPLGSLTSWRTWRHLVVKSGNI